MGRFIVGVSWQATVSRIQWGEVGFKDKTYFPERTSLRKTSKIKLLVLK